MVYPILMGASLYSLDERHRPSALVLGYGRLVEQPMREAIAELGGVNEQCVDDAHATPQHDPASQHSQALRAARSGVKRRVVV